LIEIHTDGSAIDNPGPGGWAAIIVEDGSKTVVRGGEEHTTNNRMEILAVVKGLESVPDSAEVAVFSDSTYVVNTMTRNWKRNANRDLWALLDAEVARCTVSFHWVRGHDGNPMNEEADVLANREARRLSTPSGASLSHIDEAGKVRMVDVGSKPDTERVAVARGSVVMQPETLGLIKSSGFDKGDVLGVARVAGIMAAKETAHLIPLCHPLPLHQVIVDFELDAARSAVNITATTKTTAKTGVEMEALTAVSVAALTIYDMCKSADRGMRIDAVRLVSKSGGKSGDIVLEDVS
jgi:cyclic pyranopterin phosphate synthase